MFPKSPMEIVFIHRSSPHYQPDPLVLGGKGAGLVRMASLGLDTPPGFILPVGFQDAYQQASMDAPCVVPQAIMAAVEELERATGKKLGDTHNPLWVSVRSSGPVSMPGMMDTFLNIGLTSANACRRWPHLSPEDAANHYVQQVKRWTQLWGGETHSSVAPFHPPKVDHQHSRQDVCAMLWRSIRAVWQSAHSPRAVAYRAQQVLPAGTSQQSSIAVVVQHMVCGDLSDTSGTGVLFTRCPDTGKEGLFGEWLHQAQGEDIVSGTVTPQPLVVLKETYPEIYDHLERGSLLLEQECGDIQDIEFTVENNRLWFLQTRAAKRSAVASFRYAYDRVTKDNVPIAQALSLVPPRCVDGLMHAQCMPLPEHSPLAQGLGASPGAAVGVVTLDPCNVHAHCPSILVCHSTTADDVPAMLQAQGVLTLHGGRTSHAAVIMRGAGLPCVTGLAHAHIAAGGVWIADHWIPEGSIMTLDGSTGKIYHGKVPIQTTSWTEECSQVLAWADELGPMSIWANADTPADVTKALTFGAKGIGLCRSEHMMLDPASLKWWQQWILSTSAKDKNQALHALEHLHHQALRDLLTAASGHPFVLRLLDPPLHEFLPSSTDDRHGLYQEWLMQGHDSRSWQERLAGLRPVNPMMGLRGCRLGILYPEMYRMQIRAFMRAIQETYPRQQGGYGQPGWCGLLVPLVSHADEMKVMTEMVQEVAKNLGQEPVSCGVMIETPRAALVAHEWVSGIDFVSFGTNDLTQLTWGLSRDDSDQITEAYAHLNIADPFESFDHQGVGLLLQASCQRLLRTKPSLRLSVCGEHAALPESAAFFKSAGIHALSCSPFFVPRMRVACGLLGADEKR